ncbi:HNH endonuclease [Bacillus subtilis]
MFINNKRHTWHHHQDPRRIQLVDQKVHRKTGYTFGVEEVRTDRSW